MRARLVLALAGAALVATVIPSHAASTPVLDGKKVKQVKGTASGGLQDHDQDFAATASSDRANCAPPRCYRLDFVYQPAKGVTGNVLFKITWTNPATDFDLYVATDKKATLASCGGFGGRGEQLVLSGKKLKVGKKYSLVADFYRSANDTVSALVEFPTKATTGTTVPDNVDSNVPTNCVIDANK